MDIHGPVCGPGNEFRFSRLWFCTWAALAPAMAIQNHGAIRCFESTPWPLLSQGGHLYQQHFLWSLHVSPSVEMSSNKFPHFFRLATANRRHWITGETPGKRPFLCGLPKKMGWVGHVFLPSTRRLLKKALDRFFLSNSPGQNTEMNGPEEVNPQGKPCLIRVKG